MNEPSRTTVRLDGDLSITLTPQDRRRLLIRVMCELVAYGEDQAHDDDGGLLARVDATLRGR